MNLRLRNAAEADVDDAVSWYRERGRELGDRFLEALDIRRALLRRFPYCVFYIVLSNEIVVLACVHGHRDPKIWQDRPEA